MRNRYFLTSILIVSCIFWIWWLPGPRVASDISVASQLTLKSFMDLPQTWSVKGAEGLGEYTIFTLWSWPFNFLFGFLANLGLSFVLLERILIIVPFLIVGGYGIWKLCTHFNLSELAKMVGVLFYLTNTYILLVIDGGQLSISVAYAFFPISFLAIEQAVYGGLRKKILASIPISVIGFFDIRFIYVFLILVLMRFLYEFLFLSFNKWYCWFLEWLKTGLIIAMIILGLNAYWLLVFIKFPLSTNFYSYLTKTSFTSFISLGHAFLLLSPHWFKNVFGQITGLQLEFFVIPFLIFLVPLLKVKNRIVGFWLLVTVVSIFLAKGSSEPLASLYQWFYYHVPGFSLFRDSSKFFFLIALSYTILLGIALDEIIKRVKNGKIKIIFVVCLVSYLIIIIKPVWQGLMTGTFSYPFLLKEYSQLNEIISQDKIASNILWIPTITPLTNLDVYHPSVEASRLVQKRPFAQATLGTYEIFNFLREAPYMGQLFDVANIGYIAYPYLDPRRDNLHPDNVKYYYTFLNQLSEKPWLSVVNNSPIPLFKTREHQGKFFITPNIWWVIGSDAIYNDATKSAKLKLSKNALIFAEEYPGLGKRVDELPEAKIVLSNKTSIDLAASFINPINLIFPAKGLNYDPDKSGWWKREAAALISWRAFLKDKYGIDNQDFSLGGGWAVGEGSLELRVKSEELRAGKILLARVLESSKSGDLKFYQDNKMIEKLSTKLSGDTNVRWFEVGQLTSGKELTIVSTGNINVVNALAVVNTKDWLGYRQKAKELQEKGRIFNFDQKNSDDINASVTYQQINPTQIKVSINGLRKPAFLVFSQNYDNLWMIGKSRPFPIFSLLNGFRVDKDGEYLVELEAQKYVVPGLVITGITVLTLGFLLIKFRKSPDSKI